MAIARAWQTADISRTDYLGIVPYSHAINAELAAEGNHGRLASGGDREVR